MIKKLLLGIGLICAMSLSHAAETDEAIHEELRGVLKTVETAINSGNYDQMLPVMSEQIRATPINQEFLTSRADVSRYFSKWFGQGGRIAKLEIHFATDAPTELAPDKSWGLATGSGIERYTLSDGRHYDFTTRWTATMVHEADGHWRIRGIHIGTDFLDNPILNEAERALNKIALLGGGAGLLIGLLVGWLLGRRKKKV